MADTDGSFGFIFSWRRATHMQKTHTYRNTPQEKASTISSSRPFLWPLSGSSTSGAARHRQLLSKMSCSLTET